MKREEFSITEDADVTTALIANVFDKVKKKKLEITLMELAFSKGKKVEGNRIQLGGNIKSIHMYTTTNKIPH